jgi:hypothetical protein
MSITLFAISREWLYMDIFSVKIGGTQERALLHISEYNFEILFIKVI